MECVYLTMYYHSCLPFFVNIYFLSGWGAQAKDFSKPIFPNLLNFGMCVTKWFVSVPEEAFCFKLKLFGWLVGFLTSSSTTRLYRGRAPRQSV